MKEQNKRDQIPLGLFDRLQRLLPLAEKVADEAVCEETAHLEQMIVQMFEVMQRVAEYTRDYIRRGRFGSHRLSQILHVLMICSENDCRTGRPGLDRENGGRLDKGYRRPQTCNEC